MKWTFLLFALFILPACGGFTMFKKSPSVERKLSSLQDFETDLKTLHNYHLLAQKKISAMDHKKLFVIKSKINEIETDLLKKDNSELKLAVQKFASKSNLANRSMKTLGQKLHLKLPELQKVSLKEIEAALEEVKGTREFQVIDMNVEHLSHMMTIKLKNNPHQQTTMHRHP